MVEVGGRFGGVKVRMSGMGWQVLWFDMSSFCGLHTRSEARGSERRVSINCIVMEKEELEPHIYIYIYISSSLAFASHLYLSINANLLILPTKVLPQIFLQILPCVLQLPVAFVE